MSVDLAKALIDAEGIGQDGVPDYLAVSLSSIDCVGHVFGPSSLEAEDKFARFDRTLAGLLAYVDDRVGLAQTLVVLSADHGAPEHPDHLTMLGIEAVTFDFERVYTEPRFLRLTAERGEGRDLILKFSKPYFYLDSTEIEERSFDRTTVECAVAEGLGRLPGIAKAIAISDLRTRRVQQGKINEAVLANFHPNCSGDDCIAFEALWRIADFDGLHMASAHGSPWAYDAHVPIIIAGNGIEPARIARRMETIDVAPTIAAYLGAKPPSGALGRPIFEAVR